MSKLFGGGFHEAALSVVLLDPENLNSTPEASSPSSPLTDEECTQGITENTPYGCRYCQKAFPRSYMLTRHEQVSLPIVFNIHELIILFPILLG